MSFRILFLDDYEGNRTIFETLFLDSLRLPEVKIITQTVSSYSEAISTPLHHFDLVVSDENLWEEKSGSDFYFHLRQKYAETPFILFTSEDDGLIALYDQHFYFCGEKSWSKLKFLVEDIFYHRNKGKSL